MDRSQNYPELSTPKSIFIDETLVGSRYWYRGTATWPDPVTWPEMTMGWSFQEACRQDVWKGMQKQMWRCAPPFSRYSQKKTVSVVKMPLPPTRAKVTQKESSLFVYFSWCCYCTLNEYLEQIVLLYGPKPPLLTMIRKFVWWLEKGNRQSKYANLGEKNNKFRFGTSRNHRLHKSVTSCGGQSQSSKAIHSKVALSNEYP